MKSWRELTLMLLGLFFQASSAENTTKIHYFELQIESNAFNNFSWLLGNITELTVENATVKNITITTDCDSKNCTCSQNYVWGEVCEKNPDCCRKGICPPGTMCEYKDKVLVNGKFTIESYFWDPTDLIRRELLRNMTSRYSTIDWFDSLEIISLRSGSLIGDFKMVINGPFVMSKFINKTTVLQTEMEAYFNVIITGIVKINAPDLVGYGNNVTINCTTPEILGNVKWSIQRGTTIQTITNGTEAKVYDYTLNSIVKLEAASEVWKGMFTCDYTSQSATGIINRASAYLDVALLPEILIISNPQFPDCRNNPSSPGYFDVQCIIHNSTETYTVNWSYNKQTKISSAGNTTIYSTRIQTECKETMYVVTCNFTNRKNNTANATLQIPLIKADSIICKNDGVWPDTVVNYIATMRCNDNEIGFKTRRCIGKEVWDSEISKCVNKDIQILLTQSQDLQKGCGLVTENAYNLFGQLRQTSEAQVINTIPNINASVVVLQSLSNASNIQNSPFNNSMVSDFTKASSNLLNDSLLNTMTNGMNQNITYDFAANYLRAVSGVVSQINITMESLVIEANVQLIICENSVQNCSGSLNVTLETKERVSLTKIKNIPKLLPDYKSTTPSDFVLSIVGENVTKIFMNFSTQRLPNHKVYCVYYDFNTNQWSEEGCEWGTASNPNQCRCDHLSVFTSLMSRDPVTLLYMDTITYVGLGVSIVSLVLCLVIEFVVWDTVVKTSISHFRHTVLVNIALSLLLAHISFLVSSDPKSSLSQWCLTFTVMKHFCFLAVFFWMLCMGMGLLHQIIFVFVQLRKKVYLVVCFFLGYVCPFLIVISSVITYNNGAPDSYYVSPTCWLKYERMLVGSIHTFIIPAGVIILVNMFTMVVVISRILKPNLSEGKSHDEKEILRSVIRTIVFLTPLLGITWITGFAVLMLDLTTEPLAQIVNYAFTLLNSFQGFFILLTGSFGEKKVRDALLMRIRPQHSAHYSSKSSMSMTAAVKKK